MARSHWVAAASALLSLAMAVAVAVQLADLEWHGLAALLPTSFAFWAVFGTYYLATVAGDWVIFRRLWGGGPGGIGWSGFVALMKKQVYNDLVLSYLGEAAFLAWARGRIGGKGVTAVHPVFGAIKDVAILSALAGNLVTVLLLAWLWPQMSAALIGAGSSRAVFWSILFVLALSLVLLLARRRVFTLRRGELVFAFAVHFARIVVRAILGAMVWHLLLPQVPLAWWLWLATLRQVVSRLPLVANKDLIFAGLAVLVLDKDTPVADILALTAALLIAANVLVGALLVTADAVRGWRGMRGLRARARGGRA